MQSNSFQGSESQITSMPTSGLSPKKLLPKWLRSAASAVALGLFIAFPGNVPVASASEFDLTGSLDCGTDSGRLCTFADWENGPTIGVLTEDISGTLQRVEVNMAWVRDDLGSFGQDDFVWFTVSDEHGPTLQATGVIEHRCTDGTLATGKVNQGGSGGHECRHEEPLPEKKDDDRLRFLGESEDENADAAPPLPTEEDQPIAASCQTEVLLEDEQAEAQIVDLVNEDEIPLDGCDLNAEPVENELVSDLLENEQATESEENPSL